ncbi:MAG: carbon storage regulator [Frankiales bacterium]|nr:carbon storage regulator [Frankiales bacterium]
MLVLARSAGQSVVLDERIVVTVIDTRGGVVRLGISAPGEVGVRRAELDLRPREPRSAASRHRADLRNPSSQA